MVERPPDDFVDFMIRVKDRNVVDFKDEGSHHHIGGSATRHRALLR